MGSPIANMQVVERDLVNKNVWYLADAGAPTNGTTGTGGSSSAFGPIGVGPGSQYINTTNGDLYVNFGLTIGSPTWILVDSNTGVPVNSSTNGITAHAGGGQSAGVAITTVVNRITTAASGGDSVTLPASVAGKMILIINDAASNAANVFPATGDQIDGLGANNAFSLAAKSEAIFTCAIAGRWDSLISAGGLASTQGQPGAPTLTTSTVMVMMGLAQSITPIKSTRALVTISGDVTQSTTADGAKWQISFGSGAAPANAAALTGTQVGSNPTMTFLTGVLTVPFSSQAIITGLTPGTSTWVDVALAAVTGGSASMSNLSVSIVELP